MLKTPGSAGHGSKRRNTCKTGKREKIMLAKVRRPPAG
jgi:hypothetical protein